MGDSEPLREPYVLSGCCSPDRSEAIVGYHSYGDEIKVHRADCVNLAKTETVRLVPLEWSEIVAARSFEPQSDYGHLEATDFTLLQYHRRYGVDYSLKAARALNLDRGDVFESHRKLKEAGLLERVEATMIRYREKIVKNKWIKHRNHTYYRLTDKGSAYLDYYLAQAPE